MGNIPTRIYRVHLIYVFSSSYFVDILVKCSAIDGDILDLRVTTF